MTKYIFKYLLIVVVKYYEDLKVIFFSINSEKAHHDKFCEVDLTFLKRVSDFANVSDRPMFLKPFKDGLKTST